MSASQLSAPQLSAPQLIVIADDLTGATDTGIAFTNACLETIVHLLPDVGLANHPCDVLVLSTHSRHLAPDDAHTKVASTLQPFRGQSKISPWFYKKIDSTLRGHPGPELAATLETLNLHRCLIAPAFPAQGRVTRHGLHLVDDVPLAETIFGQEVPTSRITDLFADLAPTYPHQLIDLATIRHNAAKLPDLFSRPKPALFIADAENETDLLTLTDAAVAADVRLFCGSAGLANALTRTLNLQPKNQDALGNDDGVGAGLAPALEGRPQESPLQPVLIVAGTQNPQTARQIEQLMSRKKAVHIQPQSVVEPSAIEADLQSAVQVFGETDVLVVSTAGLDLDALDGQEIARRLGAFTKVLLDQAHTHSIHPCGIVLTGGDTAMAMCMALGSSSIRLRHEVEAGVPQGTLIDGPYAGLPLVTKAGGFGTEEVLIRAVGGLSQMGGLSDC